MSLNSITLQCTNSLSDPTWIKGKLLLNGNAIEAAVYRYLKTIKGQYDQLLTNECDNACGIHVKPLS